MKKYLVYFLFLIGVVFLFNTDIKAYTVATYNGVTMDEKLIYNKFLEVGKLKGNEFDINTYSYISCVYYDNNNTYKNNPSLVCYAFNNNDVEKIGFSGDYGISIDFSTPIAFYSFNYEPLTNTFYEYNFSTQRSGAYIVPGNGWKSSAMSKTGVTNFDSLNKNDTRTYNNVLNFEKYSVDLTFNENLFENDENFKKVCIDEGKSFAITPSEGNYSADGLYDDFIWFPYGLNNGLYQIQYDSSSEYFDGNIIKYPEDVMREHFYFSSYEDITSFYDTDLPSDFENAGYTNKFSYYGYDAYNFFIVYKDGVFRFPVFTFDNPSKLHISSNGSIHGGGGLRLDGDDVIEISNEYCFYIKNGYDVTEVNVNEWGDFNGTVDSPDGDYNFNTSYNEGESNSENFLSQPISFINSMKDTINFVNSLIYELYISLPVLLRTFIITVLILLIVMLIMRIGGYK